MQLIRYTFLCIKMQAAIRKNYFLNHFIKEEEEEIVLIFPYNTHATL